MPPDFRCIPDGGGWRYVGRRQGEKHRVATPGKSRNAYGGPTNGKVERFHRTMADGWAYARCYTSEKQRRDALLPWLHHYNQHRPHTACGNQPPYSRLINVPDQYT